MSCEVALAPPWKRQGANELIDKNGKYSIESKNYSSVNDVIDYYKKLTSKYPIKSIEDPFAEDDWNAWKKIISDNTVDQYESNLMRRVCGLIYFPDKMCAEIKLRLLNNK